MRLAAGAQGMEGVAERRVLFAVQIKSKLNPNKLKALALARIQTPPMLLQAPSEAEAKDNY